MFLGKFCSQNYLCNAAFTFWLSIKEKNLNFLWNVSTDCRNFLGKSNKLIYCNSEFYLFMIMFLCVHDHVFMSFHEYEQVSVYLYLCPSLETNLPFLCHWSLSIRLENIWKPPVSERWFFKKNTILPPLLPNTHTYTDTYTPLNISSPRKVKCRGAFSFSKIVK